MQNHIHEKEKDFLDLKREHAAALEKFDIFKKNEIETKAKIESNEILKDENQEFKFRIEKSFQKIGNLDAQIKCLTSEIQATKGYSANRIDILELEKKCLQENVETALKTISSGITKMEKKEKENALLKANSFDKDILLAECQNELCEIKSRQSPIKKFERVLGEKESRLSQTKPSSSVVKNRVRMKMGGSKLSKQMND